MNKKGKMNDLFDRPKRMWKAIKRSYLYKLVSSFLSFVCSVILVILVIVGAMMFYFNMKAKAYAKKGLEYTTPFGLYTIISGSMEPNVEVYDVVVTVEEDISKLRVGDIITFISTWDINYGATVTHRVVAINKNEKGEYQLTTKGDNNQTADSATVTQTNLIGKVVGRLPQVGRLQLFLATKMGWFIVVFIPAIIVIIIDMMKIFKLYVLKSEIDNVKTPREAEKLKTEKELAEKEAPLHELQNKELKVRNKRKDKTIDTVELPKVGPDGVIKESTTALPITKKATSLGNTLYEIDLPNVHIEEEKQKDEDTLKIPVLNKKSDQLENEMPQRKKLKRRGK